MAVGHVVHGRATSSRIAATISKVTGIPVAELWPGRYPRLEAIHRFRQEEQDHA